MARSRRCHEFAAAATLRFPMLSVDEEILLNQLAQGIVSDSEGDAWFQAQNEDGKRRLLLGLNGFILQASPRQEDAAVAISEAGLKPTLTPSVLITKPDLKVQLAKLVRLPESELPRVFKLLIKLLAVADNRRRREKPLDLVNHWWHRDLRDPEVVNDIKRTKA
ncbi:hypothetical protein V1286_002663 [Bradyrhizobium algeriense]|uniref:Uncharacterized protein n=1 Tax=Bradyrhizobium algeriense TaxID=634784 RepID=A0ABU8B9B5_9BRAD